MSSNHPTDSGEQLARLLRQALCDTRLQNWGYFFPFLVALWRFIEQNRPGTLGSLDATYDGEPKFVGTGANWFCSEFVNAPVLLDHMERFMYWAASEVPDAAKERGFTKDTELPPFDKALLTEVADNALKLVDEAKSQGVF